MLLLRPSFCPVSWSILNLADFAVAFLLRENTRACDRFAGIRASPEIAAAMTFLATFIGLINLNGHCPRRFDDDGPGIHGF